MHEHRYFSGAYYSYQHPSVHLPDELVDVAFPVTEVTALNEMLELARPPATSGVGELEGPQEVGGLLEVGARGGNLVDKVLDAKNVVLAEVLLDHGVVAEWDALLGDLAVATLVNELPNRLEIRLAESTVKEAR